MNREYQSKQQKKKKKRGQGRHYVRKLKRQVAVFHFCAV
jgi:hypothetical protein